MCEPCFKLFSRLRRAVAGLCSKSSSNNMSDSARARVVRTSPELQKSIQDLISMLSLASRRGSSILERSSEEFLKGSQTVEELVKIIDGHPENEETDQRLAIRLSSHDHDKGENLSDELISMHVSNSKMFRDALMQLHTIQHSQKEEGDGDTVTKNHLQELMGDLVNVEEQLKVLYVQRTGKQFDSESATNLSTIKIDGSSKLNRHMAYFYVLYYYSQFMSNLRTVYSSYSEQDSVKQL